MLLYVLLCLLHSILTLAIKNQNAEPTVCNAKDHRSMHHSMNVDNFLRCGSDVKIVRGTGINTYAIYQGIRYKLGMHGGVLERAGFKGSVERWSDSKVLSIPMCASHYAPYIDTNSNFSSYDFKYLEDTSRLSYRELVMIDGYDFPFVRIMDIKQCDKWKRLQLHALDLPLDCVRDFNTTGLRKVEYPKDVVSAALLNRWTHPINPDLIVRNCWPLIIDNFQRRYTSQGRQDGLLEYIFHHIGATNRYVVEFGYDGSNENGVNGANTYHLNKMHGFAGLLMDGSNTNKAINLHKEMVTPSNIVNLFIKYDVPREPDYVSIDIDSADLWVFRALLADRRYRPRVISVEYNINFPLNSTITCSVECPPFKCRLFGSSFGALMLVATEFDYVLVGVVEFLDMFFIRKEDAKDLRIRDSSFYEKVTGKTYLPRTCAQKYGQLEGSMHINNHTRDYRSWVESNHNETKARVEGLEQLRAMGIVL